MDCLTFVRFGIAQQCSTTFEHCLQRSQTPIVVLLSGEQFSAQIEQSDEFLREILSLFESVGVEKNFGDQFIVRFRHRHGSKQLLQIVGQLRSTSVTFAGRIQSDEDAGIRIDLDGPIEEDQTRCTAFQCILNHLDLHGNSRENSFVQSVELIETTPRI